MRDSVYWNLATFNSYFVFIVKWFRSLRQKSVRKRKKITTKSYPITAGLKKRIIITSSLLEFDGCGFSIPITDLVRLIFNLGSRSLHTSWKLKSSRFLLQAWLEKVSSHYFTNLYVPSALQNSYNFVTVITKYNHKVLIP